MLGSQTQARQAILGFYRSSPAYRSLLARHADVRTEQDLETLPWDKIPIIDKESFYKTLPVQEAQGIANFLRSSGSSRTDLAGGKGFFWPQLRDTVAASMSEWKLRATEVFDLRSKTTLAIIGMGLGSWSGGDRFNFMLKSMSMDGELPLTVFSPGTNHAEILEIIERFGDLFEQILVIMCPSALFYLQKLAEERGTPLPFERMSFLAPGEGFPEDLRRHFERKSPSRPPLFISNYASADTDLIGLESRELLEIRQFLTAHPDIALELGFKSRSIPNLVHALSSSGYLEEVDGELIVTRWQGLPLARYNLHDSVQLFSWEKFCSELAGLDPTRRERWLSFRDKPRTDVIAIYGRSDQCLILCGTNLFGSMLEEVFLRSPLSRISTGVFGTWIGSEGGRQVLHWKIELRPGEAIPTREQEEQYHQELISILGAQQPDFLGDYQSFYKPFEKDGLRVFQFHFCHGPALSESPLLKGRIKKRVVFSEGQI